MRWIVLIVALLYVTLAQLASAAPSNSPASGGEVCLSREEAITLIAHKADIEHHEPPWVKARIWAIADRESGMQHCWPSGRVKVSATNDYGLLQFNGAGVWRNCAVNPHCKEPGMINDVAAQVDVMLNYFDKYGDFCPWNPSVNYAPGCGYR